MKKNLIFISVLLFAFFAGYSQINVNSSGNVGIKTSDPQSHFAIGDDGLTDCKAYVLSNNSTLKRGLHVKHVPNNEDFNYAIFGGIGNEATTWKMLGIYGSAVRTNNTDNVFTYGVKGIAGRGGNGYNYGVMGKLEGNRNGTGILGCSSQWNELSIDGDFAGYFKGDVYCSDELMADLITELSDLNVKKEITFLNEQSTISKIQQHQLKLRYSIRTLPIHFTQKPKLRCFCRKNLLMLNCMSMI